MEQYYVLHGRQVSCVLDCRRAGVPEVVYWGPKLEQLINTDSLSALTVPVPQADLDEVVPLSLLPEHGLGIFSALGLQGHCQGKSWSSQFQLISVESISAGLKIICRDNLANLEVSWALKLSNQTDMLQLQSSIKNLSDQPYDLQQLNLSWPLTGNFNELMTFYGRWSHEFYTERQHWDLGIYQRENRKGRTSHDNPPYLLVGERGFSETHGVVAGFHLAWSGSHQYRAERLNDGRRLVQFSEAFFPGEMSLSQGETYQTPWLYAAYSDHGLNGIRDCFHQFVRQETALKNIQNKPRPIHFNTWEAVYFTHKREKLFQMVDAAAEVGIERFILDDGWFVGRDGEKAALGDWFVDEDKYPEGLAPLIDAVHQKGMQFGLWFEPEMVNPDSNCYRDHPEWMLAIPGYQQVLGRYQYVINLTHSEAFAYIYGRLDALLSEYDIQYIKWDMNRVLVQASDQSGKALVHQQTLALYDLLKKLREKHPAVEIESCSSGGGRIDLGILQHTDRVWTSDCNDALTRQHIQRGFGYFLPPEIMGSHIGPTPAHTTQRSHRLSFRALTALFGHMGVEWDVSLITDAEREQLQHYLALHKTHRALLHHGRCIGLDYADEAYAYGVVAHDQSQALVAIAQLDMPHDMYNPILKIPYLNADQKYQVKVLEHSHLEMPHVMKVLPEWYQNGIILTGEWLAKVGMQMPIMDPESLLLLEINSTVA